ncbi:MAG: hypothetical protein PWR01_3162, partial [Clostridiales bacterium]|nr:hypothetical protein [Clostridiales bacterium]MDN5282089.1 hypothetical protein [Candidatus Ozemobacter sp.]
MKTVLEKGTIFYQGKFQQLEKLVIEKGKITEITLASNKAKKGKATTKKKSEASGQTIDCTDKFILPGFIDAHTHISLEEEGIGYMDADFNESFGLATPHVRAFDALKMRDRG